MGKDIEPIKWVVEGVLKDWKRQKRLKKEAVGRAWKRAVGKKACEHAKIDSLKGERLIVEVDESGWIYQLTLKKQDILKRLNKSLKGIKINEIQFRIGNLSRGE